MYNNVARKDKSKFNSNLLPRGANTSNKKSHSTSCDISPKFDVKIGKYQEEYNSRDRKGFSQKGQQISNLSF